MSANANLAPDADPRPTAVVLHLGFTDPLSSLRVPLPPPPALRIALTAQIGARGGHVLDSTPGLSAFHGSVSQAVQAAVEALSKGTSLLVDETARVALRAVLVGTRDGSDAARAAALTRAYRLLTLSRDNTLLLTRDLYEQLDSGLRERARLVISPALADEQPELMDLFDLDWINCAPRAAQVTQIVEPLDALAGEELLELTHGGVQLRLSPQDCPFTLGRDKSCALQLDGDVASRVHGQIEFVHDKFYFVDDSRNGTYLLTPQGEEVYLHRERLPLLGRGVISPGAPIVKQTGEVVRYACRSEQSLSALAASLPTPAAELSIH
ncbi:MAG: FHA domain-containing protein [Pseudomonadota bacterium]